MEIKRYLDSDGKRHYHAGEVDVLSVTTVLKFLEEDMTGLETWKRRNDGTGNNPDHSHLFWYKTYRGTLCHYEALNPLADEELWGEGEQQAVGELMRRDADIDVIYSLLKDHGWVSSRQEFEHRYTSRYCGACGHEQEKGTNCDECGKFTRKVMRASVLDIKSDDTAYFVEAFEEICDSLGINDESVIAVERFLLNDDDGYGGQCDLIYEDKNGNVVVSDLKTSSGLRHKHRLQAVAYARAVEKEDTIPVDEVDRVEVIRIHPDTQTWEVHTDQAISSDHTEDGWFKDPWGDFEYEDLDDMWETFRELIEKARD